MKSKLKSTSSVGHDKISTIVIKKFASSSTGCSIRLVTLVTMLNTPQMIETSKPDAKKSMALFIMIEQAALQQLQLVKHSLSCDE